MQNTSNNKEKGFTGVLVVLVVLVLLGVGLWYVINSGMFKSIPSGNIGNSGTRPALVKVDFLYKVKSITAETIVLEGKNGDFTLPNDPNKVAVYKGTTKEAPKMELTELKVNDILKVEFIPGESATLFVS